jgi:hypothetical protein
MKHQKRIATLLIGLGSLAITAKAAPVVDLALVLASDVSGSVDGTDFNLMRTGYVNAFNSPALLAAILAGPIGKIAVTKVYWSDGVVQSIGWTVIESAASATAFATAIATTPRPFGGGTGLANAINFSAGLFATAPEATRYTIDIAGDGADSEACNFSDPICVPAQNARDAFLGGGKNRSINALWIDDRDFFGDDPSDIIDALLYGATNVIGGPGSFQGIVDDFPDFERAIGAKLEREIRNPVVPEPSTYAMAGSALLAVWYLKRRR